MSKHHVEVNQLAIAVGGDQPKCGPYMNVVAVDYVALGVVTHSHMQVTALMRDRKGFIGLFAFPTLREFNEYSATWPGEWQVLDGLSGKEVRADGR